MLKQTCSGLTRVAEVDELFGQQVGEQLHDEQQVLILVLFSSNVTPFPALVVFGVDLQQCQTRLIQLHGLCLDGGKRRQSWIWNQFSTNIPIVLKRN